MYIHTLVANAMNAALAKAAEPAPKPDNSDVEYRCLNCKLDLTRDTLGGWHTGTSDEPTWNCPDNTHGHHLPMRVE